MSIPKLEKLNLDIWFKIFIYIGGGGFLGSLFIPVQIFDNMSVMFLTLGLLLFGVGEWINHKQAITIDIILLVQE